MSCRRLKVALLLTAMLASPSVLADSPRDQAKALAEHGVVQYKLARFQDALDAYVKAYETYPTPGLLFNIGQCQRALHNHERALHFFEGYLRDKPDAANRTLVEELIAETRQELEKQKRKDEAQPPPARSPSPAPSGDATSETEALAPSIPPPVTTGPKPAREIVAPAPSAGRRNAGLVVGGVGAAVLGVGTYLGIQALSKRRSSDAYCSGQVCSDPRGVDLNHDAQHSATYANIAISVGVVGLVVGAYLVLTSSAPDARSTSTRGTTPSRHARLIPAAGPGFTGLVFAEEL